MRRTVPVLALAFLAIATSARAKTAWLGAQIGFPVPSHDVGGDLLGVDAGATLHWAQTAHVGLGLDVVYHYFPTTKDYKAGVDRYLLLTRLTAIDAPNYAFKAIQLTPHLRLTAPLGASWTTWAQIGAGAYFVDRNLAPTDWTGSFFYYVGPGLKKYTVQPGWNAALGLDAHPSANITLGIDATHHQIASNVEKGIFGSQAQVPMFNALTVGMHVLYGW